MIAKILCVLAVITESMTIAVVSYMLKYLSVIESFTEVPDEISLYIPLTGCRIRCPECNSKWLWEFTGEELTPVKFLELLQKHRGITCVCIGGGEGDMQNLNALFQVAKAYKKKTCWYTGMDYIPDAINLKCLDYIKVGSYKGYPLDNPKTNQKFYEVHQGTLVNITYKFQKQNED